MTVPELLEAISKLRVLVAGDICLDRWCSYDPALADDSRETGIPRIAVVSTEVTPGAGGTVANNLAALGAAEVAVLGAVGYDGFGYELEGALVARRISCAHHVRANLPTFTYTKLINARTGEEDLPRVDFVYAQPLPGDLERQLIARLEAAVPNYDVVIVADQSETSHGGVVTPAFRDALALLAAQNPHILFWADSRLRAEHFRRAVVKLNHGEARAASIRALGTVDLIGLRMHMEAPLLVVTHGSEGALIISRRGLNWAPTESVEKPVDTCGAGDSFSAGAALALRAAGDPLEAADFGNLVASVTIMKKGTGTASPKELLERASAPRAFRRSVPVIRIPDRAGPG
jgi:rfaE bifunctional protein kinase chain/domain